MQDRHQSAHHAYRRFLLVCITLLMIVGGLVVWLWNGPGSAIVASAPPFVIERNADGSWPEIPSDAPGFAWGIDVSERETKTRFSTQQTASNAKGARIATRSVAIFNERTGPLADLIARGVIAGLQTDNHIDVIRYAPVDGNNPTGKLAPDLVIKIDSGEYDEARAIGSGIGTGESHSEIKVTMSDELARGIHSTISPNDAPHLVQFHMTLTSNTDIQQDGIATPNARLKATAKSLSDGILDRVRDSLNKLRLEHGTCPELPATFYPEYLTVDESKFDIGSLFDQEEPFRQLASWRDRYIHNRTWWQSRVAGDMQTSMARIGERLEAAGFERKGDSKHNYDYRLGDIEVELIPERVRPTGIIVRVPGQEPKRPQTTNLHVRYTHRASKGFRLAALESVISDGSSPELLMLCSPAWNGEQRKRGQALVDTLNLQDPRQLIRRAALRHYGGDDKGAADDLARAVVFGQTSFQGGPSLQDARKDAKKWGIEFEALMNDRDWLLSAGFVELTVGGDPAEKEATPGAPLRAFYFHQDSLTTIAAGLKANKKTNWGGAFLVNDGSRTEQSGLMQGRASHQVRGGTATVQFLDDPTDGQSRARIDLH